MKRLTLSFALPLALLAALNTAFAQTADSAKIKEVEKNLIGMIQMEGEGPWTIKERMERRNSK